MSLRNSLQEIEESDLQDLVDNQVRESRDLEYKLEVPGNSSGAKKGFLAEVASFANTTGGNLIIGIADDDGVASDCVGVELQSVDEGIHRLHSILEAGLDPRIPGLSIRDVELTSGNVVLIVRVPHSVIAPHMITFEKSSRFYARNSTGKYPMDVREIRAAFSLTVAWLIISGGKRCRW